MDRNFLDFWGNYLLSLIPTGQKFSGEKFYNDAFKFWGEILKDRKAADWLYSPSGYLENQVEFFRKAYGLKDESSPDYFDGAKKASDDFHKSLKEFISAFDVVPREDFEQLKKDYHELQERCDGQEETIRQLRIKLLAKGAEEIGAASGIQDMIKSQTEQFTSLMDSLGRIYGGTASKQGISEKPKKKVKR